MLLIKRSILRRRRGHKWKIKSHTIKKLRAPNNHNAQFNSIITIVTHLEGVVYFFVFYALFSSTRLFKSLFFCVSNSMFLFLLFVEKKMTSHCKIHHKMIAKYHNFKKNKIPWGAGTVYKYIYGQPNFIYLCKKDVKCAKRLLNEL